MTSAKIYYIFFLFFAVILLLLWKSISHLYVCFKTRPLCFILIFIFQSLRIIFLSLFVIPFRFGRTCLLVHLYGIFHMFRHWFFLISTFFRFEYFVVQFWAYILVLKNRYCPHYVRGLFALVCWMIYGSINSLWSSEHD